MGMLMSQVIGLMSVLDELDLEPRQTHCVSRMIFELPRVGGDCESVDHDSRSALIGVDDPIR